MFYLNNIISLNNVTFEYSSDEQKTAVVKDFSLNIEKGSFTAILGHNGSGKSTLAKLFNGLIKPTKGTVIVDGLDTAVPENEIEVKKKVGMIFQNPDNQIVASVVEEDVAFGLENIGVEHSIMVKRVEDALKSVDMLEYRQSSPYKLSGGQKQRVAIAGILAMEPACIVLDEPTAMLDPKGRRDVINTINKLCREKNITIVLITHYMEEATIADRVVVLDNGGIVLDGKPDKVFSNVKLLKSCGLDVPQPTEVLHRLKTLGLNVKENIISIDDTVKEISKVLEDN